MDKSSRPVAGICMSEPREAPITIGVPVYNGERFLRQCLDSLLSQTFANFLLVIRDNASTDATSEICRQYLNSDSRISYQRNATNVGLYGNFNLILESVRTRYMKLATADDFWAPTMLADCLAAMERDPSVALCYPRATL